MKFKNGDTICTIYGDTATIVSVGKNDDELTKLDREIQIGFYGDGVPHVNCFIETRDLYTIVKTIK